MKLAQPTDWGELKQLPAGRATLVLNRLFSAQEMKRIQRGLIPEQMEDKWFIYWQDNTLYFHRSWTGMCIYIVRFIPEGNEYRMIEADVNRDEGQYRGYGDEREPAVISDLIDWLLLRREPEPEEDEPVSDDQALEKWGQVGRAMLCRHPGDIQ